MYVKICIAPLVIEVYLLSKYVVAWDELIISWVYGNKNANSAKHGRAMEFIIVGLCATINIFGTIIIFKSILWR